MEKTHSDQINEIAQALSKMQMEVGSIIKNKTAKIPTKTREFSFSYADLAAILDAIRKPLANHGLSITQTFENHNGIYHMVSTLMHSSGQFIKSLLPINVNALDIKQIGAQITYSRRYALTALLGICADDDNEEGLEGNALSSTEEKKKEPSKLITKSQEKELEHLLNQCDESYIANVRKYYSDHKKVNSWSNLTQDMYLALHENICKKLDKKKEIYD